MESLFESLPNYQRIIMQWHSLPTSDQSKVLAFITHETEKQNLKKESDLGGGHQSATSPPTSPKKKATQPAVARSKRLEERWKKRMKQSMFEPIPVKKVIYQHQSSPPAKLPTTTTNNKKKPIDNRFNPTANDGLELSLQEQQLRKQMLQRRDLNQNQKQSLVTQLRTQGTQQQQQQQQRTIVNTATQPTQPRSPSPDGYESAEEAAAAAFEVFANLADEEYSKMVPSSGPLGRTRSLDR